MVAWLEEGGWIVFPFLYVYGTNSDSDKAFLLFSDSTGEGRCSPAAGERGGLVAEQRMRLADQSGTTTANTALIMEVVSTNCGVQGGAGPGGVLEGPGGGPMAGGEGGVSVLAFSYLLLYRLLPCPVRRHNLDIPPPLKISPWPNKTPEKYLNSQFKKSLFPEKKP